MKTAPPRPFDVVVVDANPPDYELLLSAHRWDNDRIRLFVTGEDALQVAGAHGTKLWIVNTRLPDMTGIHFLRLIRRRLQRSSVFLVGDIYSAEDEFAARLAGATAYVCKPATSAWWEALLAGPRSAVVPRTRAIRAGPQRLQRLEP